MDYLGSKANWIYCPVCGSKTRDRALEDMSFSEIAMYCGNGIENDALHRIPSPEEIFMQKVLLEQLYKALHTLPPQQCHKFKFTNIS